MYKFENVMGKFVFDKRGKLSKGKGTEQPTGQVLSSILAHFKSPSYFPKFREANIRLTKKRVRESVTPAILIIQAAQMKAEINRIMNMLLTRFREWYAYFAPEAVHDIRDPEKLLRTVKSLEKPKDSMGADLKGSDVKPMAQVSQELQQLFELEGHIEEYIKKAMSTHCPNVSAVAGPALGARLLVFAGSLKRLAEFPASTIQLLGAEKALFRHLVTKARSPKYGILFTHPLVQKAKQKGRMARALADKIALAAKVDYFKGDFIGDKLRKSLEKKQ